jgi:hypothetical protein
VNTDPKVEAWLTTPPIDPGLVDRGWVVWVWNPAASRYWSQTYVVISNNQFHSNGRDEVQLLEFERPFNPIVVARRRLKLFCPLLPAELQALERGFADLIGPGLADRVPHPCSQPGCVPQLDFDQGSGIAYAMTPVLVVSRPLVWASYDKAFFMDIGLGTRLKCDWRLVDPVRIRLPRGAFVCARVWSTDVRNLEIFNRDQPAVATRQDLDGAIHTLANLVDL